MNWVGDQEEEEEDEEEKEEEEEEEEGEKGNIRRRKREGVYGVACCFAKNTEMKTKLPEDGQKVTNGQMERKKSC